MEESPYKNVYIDSRGKYRRFSGLVEHIPKSYSKRLKTDTSPGEHNSLNASLALLDETSTFSNETPSKLKLPGLGKKFKNNIKLHTDEPEISLRQIPFKAKVGRPRKNKSHTLPLKKNGESISKTKLGTSLKEKSGLASLHGTTADRAKDIAKLRREIIKKEDLNVAFVEGKNDNISTLKTGGRERRQRRLSGIYKKDLNTGFIEDQSIFDEEISPLNQILLRNNCHEEDPSSQSNTEETLETADEDSEKDICTTPVKSKLRRRQPRKTTEEDIVKYYTDKTIKKKQNTLETIFETPKPDHVMSVKKYKRFINFNERMSNVKVRKRCSKIVKYNLWQNIDPVSEEYFSRKLEEVEKDL